MRQETIDALREQDGGPVGRRAGDWFLSFKGRQVYPFDLRPEDVDIEEIAHSLSMLCRFNGHSRHFYSVAQHSVLVAIEVECSTLDLDVRSTLALTALLHDGTEAFVGDMIRPLKRSLPAYCEVEDRAWLAIADRFKLPRVLPPEIKIADNRMLQTERRDLLAPHTWAWTEDREGAPKPFEANISPWSPSRAEAEFLSFFNVYHEGHILRLATSSRREFYPGETT